MMPYERVCMHHCGRSNAKRCDIQYGIFVMLSWQARCISSAGQPHLDRVAELCEGCLQLRLRGGVLRGVCACHAECAVVSERASRGLQTLLPASDSTNTSHAPSFSALRHTLELQDSLVVSKHDLRLQW